jgi:hypothetical protein
MAMGAILIRYNYDGDDAPWREALETFVSKINADPKLAGRFRYEAGVMGDGAQRVHVGHWDSEETLKHLQAQPFFKEFSGKVQGFAGDTLAATRFEPKVST